VVDARRCLAWLVQAAGPFPVAFRAALGDRIYGCDDCQEVCPPNRAADRRRPGEPHRPAGPAGAPGGAPFEGAWVPLLDLLAASDDALLAAHGRWYVPDRDPRYLRRNAILALGNVGRPGDPAVLGALRARAAGPDELLAEHARWALDRLQERARG
jgi:epoxyqueuosine reductase